MKTGTRTPPLAATKPTTTESASNPFDQGKMSTPTPMMARPGAIVRQVAVALNQGENTTACAMNMTRLHSANSTASCVAPIPNTPSLRSAKPTSKTPTATPKTSERARRKRTALRLAAS